MFTQRNEVSRYINTDYLSMFKEGPIIRRCASRIQRAACSNNRILIIVPCLIGDFVTAIPSLVDFIQRHEGKTVDLVVTSPLKALASRIVTIGQVYSARTTQERDGQQSGANSITGDYEHVIILKSSQDVLDHIIPHIRAARVSIMMDEITHYVVFDLLKNNILRRRPTPLRDFSFSLLGGVPRDIPLEQMLSLHASDAAEIRDLSVVSGERSNVAIHTGASWPMMRWPNERWIAFLNRLNDSAAFNFIFVGLEQDRRDFEYIASRLDFVPQSVIGRVDILGLAILLTMVDAFIGVDSGPGNIAHLVGLNSLIIYGPGPHIYFSARTADVALDRSNGRGIFQRYFTKKHGFIHRVTVDDAYDAFQRFVP